MTDTVLQFDNVVKRFGDRTILDGVSTAVQAGVGSFTRILRLYLWLVDAPGLEPGTSCM